MPLLILPGIQLNIRAGALLLLLPEANGVSNLSIPLRVFPFHP
jgi:hypothetical protein